MILCEKWLHMLHRLFFFLLPGRSLAHRLFLLCSINTGPRKRKQFVTECIHNSLRILSLFMYASASLIYTCSTILGLLESDMFTKYTFKVMLMKTVCNRFDRIQSFQKLVHQCDSCSHLMPPNDLFPQACISALSKVPWWLDVVFMGFFESPRTNLL